MWRLVRALLFRIDAERAHHVAMALFSFACAIPGVRALVRRACRVDDPALKVTRWGLEFPSPVGLAAGFDKDARWFEELGALGFGLVEVGTLTARAQPGNPRPRLFRLPRDRALVNRFGFNNEGAERAGRRLARRRGGVVLGVNIGKSKVVPNEEAVADYVASLGHVFAHADYVVVNVSSPNTPGLRALQDRDALKALLSALRARNDALAAELGTRPRPLLVKIAPDLTDGQLDDVVSLALELGLDGIVATNTTISREGLATPRGEVEALGAGGLSGAPLTERSRAFVAEIHRRSGGRLPIIGVGGVMGPEDAWELVRAGASLVQVYTGFVYGGPLFARDLNRGLAQRLRERGVRLDDVVGEAVREMLPRKN